jgi:Flp pilus assembly protein TadD
MNRTFATRSTLFETIELINSGRIGQAEAICRAAVERNEQDVNMTALLGATLFKAGKTDEAERWLRHTMQLAPNFAKPWGDLGQLLLETRRAQEAVDVLEEAVRLDARDGDAWFHLGKARAVLGRGRAADEAFEQSFELNPARAVLAQAAEHQHAGRWAEARRSAAKSCAAIPATSTRCACWAPVPRTRGASARPSGCCGGRSPRRPTTPKRSWTWGGC